MHPRRPAPDDPSVRLEWESAGEKRQALRGRLDSFYVELSKPTQVASMVFVVMGGDDLLERPPGGKISDKGPLIRRSGVNQSRSKAPQNARRVDPVAVTADAQTFDVLPFDLLSNAQCKFGPG